MGKVNNNPILQHNSGAIGKTIVYKRYAYGVVTSKYPDMSNVVPSEAQLVRRRIFALANAYAKTTCKDPEWIKLNVPVRKSKKQKNWKTPFRIALSQYMQKHAAQTKALLSGADSSSLPSDLSTFTKP